MRLSPRKLIHCSTGLQELQWQMHNGFDKIHERLDIYFRQQPGEERELTKSNHAKKQIVIPKDVKQSLIARARQRYPDLVKMPLREGVESAIYFMIRATLIPEDSKEQEGRSYALRVLNLMKAIWLMRTAKCCEQYKECLSYEPDDKIERQLIKWGMNDERYIEKIEQV
jgi:hypothetical protein